MSDSTIRCPRCGQLTQYKPENSFRPFCSERCQTLDLGQWASEKYSIADSQADVSESEVNQNSSDDDGEDASPLRH